MGIDEPTFSQANSWLSGFLKSNTNYFRNCSFVELPWETYSKVYGNLNTQFLIIYRIQEYIPLYYLLLITRVGKMHWLATCSEAFKWNTIKIQTFKRAVNKIGNCIILCIAPFYRNYVHILVVPLAWFRSWSYHLLEKKYTIQYSLYLKKQTPGSVNLMHIDTLFLAITYFCTLRHQSKHISLML
jgi:hypothetical protein